jgi:pimeloyl-ACP methyl ester carboxylesterase
MLLDPWAWIKCNAVDYAGGEFKPRTPGIQDRGFGTDSGVCDLCPEASTMDHALRMTGAAVSGRTRYFAPLRDAMRDRGCRMYSATYDFRTILDPRVLATYRLDLLGLVARARRDSGGRRVVLVAHSLGCVLANHLLLSDPEWLERNVAHIVDVCPASEGSVYPLDCMLNGRMYLGSPSGSLKTALARMARSNAGLILSLPFPGLCPPAGGQGDPGLSSEDYSELVGDAWLRYAHPIMAGLRSPGVRGRVGHVLIHSTGRRTPTSIARDGSPCSYIEGDGVVLPLRGGGPPSRLVGSHTVVMETPDSHSLAPGGKTLIAIVSALAAV